MFYKNSGKDLQAFVKSSQYAREESEHKYTVGDCVMFAKPYDLEELLAGIEKMI